MAWSERLILMGRRILVVIHRELWPEGAAQGNYLTLRFGDDEVCLAHDSGHTDKKRNLAEILAARGHCLSVGPSENLLTVVHGGSLGPLLVGGLDFPNAVYSRIAGNENFQLVQAMLVGDQRAFSLAWNRLQRDGCFGCLACCEAYRVIHDFPKIGPPDRQSRAAYVIPVARLTEWAAAIPPVIGKLEMSNIAHPTILEKCNGLSKWLSQSDRTLAALDLVVDEVVMSLQAGCQ